MATDADCLICHEKFVEFAAELEACKTAPPPAEAGVWTVAGLRPECVVAGLRPECVVAAPCPRWLRLPTRGPADPT